MGAYLHRKIIGIDTQEVGQLKRLILGLPNEVGSFRYLIRAGKTFLVGWSEVFLDLPDPCLARLNE